MCVFSLQLPKCDYTIKLQIARVHGIMMNYLCHITNDYFFLSSNTYIYSSFLVSFSLRNKIRYKLDFTIKVFSSIFIANVLVT